MRPLAFLKCLGKAALKQAANVAGFGLGEVAEQVWDDWNKEKDEAQRHAELQAVVQMAAQEVRAQVEAVVREVAAAQPAEVQRRLSEYLQQVPEVLRKSFRRPDDQKGLSVPPGLRVRQAGDLASILASRPGEAAASPTPARPQVALHFTEGLRTGLAEVYTEPTVLLFGRGLNCQPRLPEQGHNLVSRNHCLVEIIPPDVRLRDLGSRNGTYLDGQLIGKRPAGEEPDPKYTSPEHDLANGAEVWLTDSKQVAFQVRIVVPAQCSTCGAGIADDQKSACARDGGYLCPRCQADQAAGPLIKTCSMCQREVQAERGANRPGRFICSDCRGNLEGIIKDLLGQAHQGKPELHAIREYELLEELGHGGMGAVYLARHKRTGEAAAIKLMLPQLAADDRAVELFQREIRNTMSLNHRNVVRLLDHGYARGAFFLVMEYCDGGSADQLLAQRGGVLPVDEATEIILQALEGLEYCHTADIPFVKKKGGGFGPGKGLVHRDLKPANLFLTGWGSSRRVKIGDYGLAKAFEETGLTGGTRTGDALGTCEYMCRRQVAHSKDAGPEVDVWSLAASFYELLTGQVPRDFSGDQDKWLIVLENKPVPILERNPRLPSRLAEVIDLALREEPDMPFKTAAEFRQAIEEALVGVAVQAR